MANIYLAQDIDELEKALGARVYICGAVTGYYDEFTLKDFENLVFDTLDKDADGYFVEVYDAEDAFDEWDGNEGINYEGTDVVDYFYGVVKTEYTPDTHEVADVKELVEA